VAVPTGIISAGFTEEVSRAGRDQGAGCDRGSQPWQAPQTCG